MEIVLIPNWVCSSSAYKCYRCRSILKQIITHLPFIIIVADAEHLELNNYSGVHPYARTARVTHDIYLYENFG